jgi:hypothetical protein
MDLVVHIKRPPGGGPAVWASCGPVAGPSALRSKRRYGRLPQEVQSWPPFQTGIPVRRKIIRPADRAHVADGCYEEKLS